MGVCERSNGFPVTGEEDGKIFSGPSGADIDKKATDRFIHHEKNGSRGLCPDPSPMVLSSVITAVSGDPGEGPWEISCMICCVV